jgi:hypothetical protein
MSFQEKAVDSAGQGLDIRVCQHRQNRRAGNGDGGEKSVDAMVVARCDMAISGT